MTKKVYDLTTSFPTEERYGLISQMRRCSVSIPSNIAEGCRGSDKELLQFLNISLGSSFELETQLIISKEIGYVDTKQCKILIEELTILQKRINAFRNAIKKAN